MIQGESRPIVVSVIMPSFNSSRHIEEAIQSVLNQSFRDFELLIVDGGSSDQTRFLVMEMCSADARIRLIDNCNDRGPAHARHAGIQEAKGKYIAFLDADDYWLPEKLAVQVELMEKNNIKFSYTRFRKISEDGLKTSCIVPVRASFNFQQALRNRGIGSMTVMIHHSLLTPVVTKRWMRSGGEETFWWILILRGGANAKLIDRDLARYRDTAGSLSKNQVHTLRSVWRMYRAELGLSLGSTILNYVLYIADVVIRRLRLRLCSLLESMQSKALA